MRTTGATFPKPSYNDKGEMIRPDISYREWVYVGTPLTPNDLNPPEAPFPGAGFRTDRVPIAVIVRIQSNYFTLYIRAPKK